MVKNDTKLYNYLMGIMKINTITLYEHLILQGYHEEDAKQLQEIYTTKGIDATVESFTWADKGISCGDEHENETAEKEALRGHLILWGKYDQYDQMSDEEKTRAIAELDGWKRCDTEEELYYREDGDEYGTCQEHSDDFEGDQILPDYLNDLNECHKLEWKCYIQWGVKPYARHLKQTFVNGSDGDLISATAGQRGKAFHSTMTECNYRIDNQED